MRKTGIVFCLILAAVALGAQATDVFRSMDRDRHNFHLIVPGGVYIDLELYVDGVLVSENQGFVDPATMEDGQSTRRVSHGLTFGHSQELDGSHKLSLEGRIRAPESGETAAIGGEIVVDDLQYVYDSGITINADGTVEFFIAYM